MGVRVVHEYVRYTPQRLHCHHCFDVQLKIGVVVPVGEGYLEGEYLKQSSFILNQYGSLELHLEGCYNHSKAMLHILIIHTTFNMTFPLH
jgi:hypothetical protein